MTFHDPLLAAGGRAMLLTGPFGAPERVIDLDRPMAIAEIIAAHDLSFSAPTIAVLDGEPVLRGVWAMRVIRPGEVISFVAVPRGGGGEGGGKQIIGLIAALALSLAAPMIGGWVAGALFGGSAMAASLVSGALLVGGSLLLNALMATPAQESAKADQVYSVNAASNQATPLEPLPNLYGRLRYVPRHASRPYSEYEGNDQYLYQLFFVTTGKADIERIDIGETEAWNAVSGYSSSFSDLQFQIVQPGQAITLFPANVVTSGEVSGQTVPDPAAVLGPFVVNAAGSTVNRLAVDFAFPGGLWTANGSAVNSNSIALRAQYQRIDNAGVPIGGWSNLFAQTISAATRTPQRMSRAAQVPAGRYQVRFLADEPFDSDDAQAVNRVVWTGLRGYLTDFVTPPNCTLLAMKVRANEQLSQFSSNQIRVTAERYLPVWNGLSWVEQKTRSIAWAAADLLMNSDYSIGLTPAQFDLAQLAQLAATWASRGDTFNAIFDRSWTVQDALRAILRAGRAQAVRMGGRVSFVRLEPKSIRRAVFSPRNVVRGSFQHKLVLFDEEKPDSVAGSFIDEQIWQTREVIGSLASVGADAPQKIEWFGITNHAQAWRESVTEAAVNAYNREFVSFTADWEGKLLVRGEPILVHHPFIEGVESAALANRAGDVLTIDRDPAAEITGTAYVILRGKTGKEWGPCLVDSIVGRTITLNAADRALVAAGMGSLVSILPDDRSEPAHVLICDGVMRPFNGLVVSAVPGAKGKVDIAAVIDAPEVHLADGTEIMPSPWWPPALPPQNPARPLLFGLYAYLRADIAQLELEAMWQPSAGAIGGYVAEISYDDDGLPDTQKAWTPVYKGDANRFTVPVLPQKLVLRVAALGVLQGPWAKRVFTLADVPTITIPQEFFDIDEIADEVEGRVVGLDEWARYNTRENIEEKRKAILLNVEGAVGDYKDRQRIRQEATSTFEASKASWTLDILAATGPTSALSLRLEELTAAVTDPVTGLVATNDIVNLLSAEIGVIDGSLTAVNNSILQLDSSVGKVSAAGLFRVETVATEAGASTTIGLLAVATSGSASGVSGLYLNALSDGSSDAFVVANRFAVKSTPTGTKYGIFVIDTGVVWMDEARIRNLTAANVTTRSLTADKLVAGTLTSAEINVQQLVASNAFLTYLKVGSAQIDDLSVDRIKIANGAVTDFVTTVFSGTTLPSGNGSFIGDTFIATAGPFIATASISVSQQGSSSTSCQLWLDNVTAGTSQSIASGGRQQSHSLILTGTAGQTYRLRWTVVTEWDSGSSPLTGSANMGVTIWRK